MVQDSTPKVTEMGRDKDQKRHLGMVDNPVTSDTDAADIDPGSGDPFELFTQWMEDAQASEIPDVAAMALATVDSDDRPDVRMVLAKDWDARGLTFYTNLESDKADQLASNCRAAAVFHWKTLRRQVRFRGPVSPVDTKEADAYFATRHPQSQIAARVSDQSSLLASRDDLIRAFEAEEAQLEGKEIPRPGNWSGYRLQPVEIEFWQNRAFRLHDRLKFRRDDPLSQDWSHFRLHP